MTDEQPTLGQPSQKWYQGLTKYHWFVLIVASMGWMFDTMDQQFFNLGRGPAMMQILDYDPIPPGLEKLGEKAKFKYTAEDLDGLVASGLITADQKADLLVEKDGKKTTKVSRKDVATAVGAELLVPRLTELGLTHFKEKGIDTAATPVFDEAAMADLVAKEVMNQEDADKLLAQFPAKEISREDLALHVGKELARSRADDAGNTATLVFVMGWAIGGLFFGWIGDALGRAKTMAVTILVYAVFTGLNGLAQTEFQFNLFRFLTALGVGGEFAAGAALVAESMPDRSRPAALGTLQALSAIGNMAGAALAFFIMPVLGWRWLFAVGALPGIVAVFVFLGLREPEKWKQARAKWLEDRAKGGKLLSSYAGLFQDARWRKRAIVGMLLGVVGVGGLWGVAFFTPELNRMIARSYSEEAKEKFVAVAFFLQQFGAFLGIAAYTWVSLTMGRRPAFAFFFVIAFFIMSYTFLAVDTITEAYIVAPLIGFVTLGPFGGYAIYFPELFPTRLRATGTGFCYNVGRFLAALVPKMKNGLKGLFMGGAMSLPFLPAATGNAELAVRYGSFMMIFIYLIGLVVLLFAPETKGQPLPED